jgi:type I restriction enzyme M protein
MNNFRQKVDLIWDLANLLRHDFKPHEYADVILPLVVLRRLDQAMEPTRAAVRKAYEEYKGKLEKLDSVLSAKAGGSLVYNRSEFNWQRLLDAPGDLQQNVIAYLNGFSPEVLDIIEKFDFRRQVARLQSSNLLYPILKEFSNVDLHPDRVDNIEMGYIFEELIRRFSEQYNETAGEHFTPREVIELMVDLLLSENPEDFLGPDKIVEIYDPACGTGGMLSEGKKGVTRNHGQNPAQVYLFGQEINPTSYAVAKADLLLKGEDPRRLAFGNSFTEDGHKGKRFRLMLSNPPFGVEWKKYEYIIKNEYETLGHEGRFGAGLPRITDGSFLFLQHMLAKRFEDKVGSRIAIIFNGSPLFTGDAGSGESEIRRWIIENDWLEGIVALPEQLFYNTGIATYIWIVTNRKSARRKGKVQLLNAADFWEPMTPRSLGNKRRYIAPQHRQRVVALYKAMEENEYCRIFDNTDFGYRRVRIERPLRLNFRAAPERIERLKEDATFQNLTNTRKKDPEAIESARQEGERQQQAILAALRTLPDQISKDPNEYNRWLNQALKGLDFKMPDALRKAILNALTERDETADPVPDKKGGYEPDTELRDYENVPLQYAPSIYDEDVPLKENVYAYFKREVQPYVPDAWIDEAYCDDRDGKVGKVGYEINFNRYFYKYTPPPHPEELARLIEQKEQEIAQLIRGR